MMRLQTIPWAALLLTSSVSGCGTKSPVKPVDPFVDPFEERKLAPAVEADSRVLVEANNRFALDLYSRLRTNPGNLFLSPYSMSTAFGMAYAGAAGQTEEEMARVFRFPLPAEKLHAAF